MKYRILMITTGFAPYEFSEAIVNSKLVLALIDAGHDVDVISRENNQAYSIGWTNIWKPLRSSTYFVNEEKVSNIKRLIELIYAAFFFFYPIYGIRWGVKVYKMAIKMHKKNHYDILLTRMPSMITHLIGKKINRKSRIPWIANWNDPTDNIRPLLKKKNPINNLIINNLVRSVFEEATFNTFPSKELWEHYNSKILHKNDMKVDIIPHISITYHFNTDKKKVKNRVFSICHAGNIGLNIDTELLIKAIARIKQEKITELEFHFFGIVDKRFLELISKYDLEDTIKYYKSVTYELLMSDLPNYDVLLLLEGQYEKGILLLSKLSDYVSIGRPILALSPVSGVIPELINQYGGGLAVDNTNTQSIYDGLKTMIYEWKGNWENKRISSSANLFGQFCPERIVGSYEAIFTRIIHK